MKTIADFITIKNIKDCLSKQGIIWDGLKGKTDFTNGEKATIEDFDDFNLVPIRVNLVGHNNEYDILLRLSSTKMSIFQEKYHPYDDEYMEEILREIEIDWKNTLLKEHKAKYANILVNEIDEEIELIKFVYNTEYVGLSKQLQELESKTSKEIENLEKQQQILKSMYEEPEKEEQQ